MLVSHEEKTIAELVPGDDGVKSAYVQKVFRLHDLATQVADSRYRRRILVSSVILAWVYGFMTMVRSTEQHRL